MNAYKGYWVIYLYIYIYVSWVHFVNYIDRSSNGIFVYTRTNPLKVVCVYIYIDIIYIYIIHIIYIYIVIQSSAHAACSPIPWQDDAAAAAKKQGAMDAALRRICTPKPGSGRLEVSMEIHRQWKAGGAQRKCLLNMLIKADGNKDPNYDWKISSCGFLLSKLELSSPPWRMNSRNKSSTCRRSLGDPRFILKGVFTPKKRWRPSLDGNHQGPSCKLAILLLKARCCTLCWCHGSRTSVLPLKNHGDTSRNTYLTI